MVLNNHSRDTSVPSFCPWDEGTCAFGAGPSVPGVSARPSAPQPPPPGSAPDYHAQCFEQYLNFESLALNDLQWPYFDWVQHD